MAGKLKTALAAIAVTLAAIAVWLLVERDIRRLAFPESTEAAFDFSEEERHGTALIFGYNYHLLKQFCSDKASEVHARAASPGESLLDSLDAHSIDIIILPFRDSIPTDSLHSFIPVDSAGIWVLRKSERHNVRHIVKWTERLRERPEYKRTRDTFMGMYDPAKHTDCDFLSPYDSLVKIYADSLGWDWRLLSAVIYAESKFKIEARSHRGASGLMQVMPHIAAKEGWDDLLDPENNLKAGTAMLRNIPRKYRLWGSDEERLKYTLASYNAGPAKVRACVEHAVELGINPDVWDNVADLVPGDPLDTADVSKFLDGETVKYVRRVMYIYKRYRQICPEQ